MKNVSEEIVNQYINNLRIAFSPYLKSGVGIQSIWIPYEDGSVIMIKLGFNIPTKGEKRNEAKDLTEALSRTQLFENFTNPVTVKDTSIMLLENTILVIKIDDVSVWKEENAKKDVSEIIHKINGE